MRNVFSVSTVLLVVATMLCSCGNSVTTGDVIPEQTEAAERADISSDTAQSHTHEEMTISYVANSSEVLGSNTDKGIYVYPSKESYDYAIIQVLYMPNWEMFVDYADNTAFRELHDGYVIAVTSETFPKSKCVEIADAVTEVSYVSVSDK